MKKIKSGQNMILSEEEREKMLKDAEKAYGEFLTALGYDWENDESMKKTPFRVAKMYVKEITSGAYDNPPKITVFPNDSQYDGIVFQGDIPVHSLCAHHFASIVGICHLAYIPKKDGDIIGLSKLNRIVDFLSKRPQTQEFLTKQIHDYLCEILPDNQGVIVFIKAEHMCVKLRGIEQDSTMQTSYCSGYFKTNEIGSRKEFFDMISNVKK
jgi:GTP cyclohydrolase I